MKQEDIGQEESVVERASVLVVDDNPLIVDVLRGLLRSAHYQVITASNGKEALEILTQKTVDIVICDVMMPKMGGYEFHDLLRQKPESAHVPFIFLTALDSADERQHGKEIGADDYLCKPFNPLELLAVVKGKISRVKNQKDLSEKRYDNYRRRVIHTLSHEFRTPLVAINTGMELLLEYADLPSDSKAKSLIDAVKRGGQRLERLVSDFMVLQQIDAGIALRLFDSRAEVQSISGLLNRFIEIKLPTYIQAGAIITWRDDSDARRVRVVDAQIIDCLDRIVSNAVKFSNGEKRVEIEAYALDQEVCIDVRDRGVGLDPTKLTEAVDVFGQLNREKLEQQGGGLGLSIANSYATINKGRLEFEPRQGGGSTVTLTLPVLR